MSAKLLHVLADDNPDLQKQIGCMTGIYQLFDRQNTFTTGRRITNHSHNRIPTGHSHLNNVEPGGETTNGKYFSKSVNEKQRVPVESSRTSYSSSSSSSTFSSVDCNQPARLETPPRDRNIFSETSSKQMHKIQQNASPQLRQPSLDFRDVVKDSIYKEACSANSTAKDDSVKRGLKQRNYPRSFQLSESLEESHEVGNNGILGVPADFSESLRLLNRLREGSGSFNDTKEPPRSSYEARHGSSFSVPKDAPRFSYDGQEISRFDSRGSYKCSTKLKELPRLSLDSKGCSMKRTDSCPKSNSNLKDLERDSDKAKISPSPQQAGSHSQHSNIVAKLMGLEIMPTSDIAAENQRRLTESYHDINNDSFSTSSKRTTECKQIRTPSSPRSSFKEPISPRSRSLNLVMKPISSSPFPIEPAPWRQLDGGCNIQKSGARNLGSPQSSLMPSPSVYTKIEKRLKELEFKQLDDDLRTLKHMLDAMHEKGLLESAKEEEQASNFEFEKHYDKLNYPGLDHNSRSANRRNPSNRQISATVKDTSPPEYPIVIMKPAKNAVKSCTPSSVNPSNGISSPQKLRSGDSVDSRKGSVNGRVVKNLNPKVSLREHVQGKTSYTDKKANATVSKSVQTSSRSQQLVRENTLSSTRSSGSISPRIQQKRPELEKPARPPISSTDLSKPRKQSVRKSNESGSPRGKRKPKPINSQHIEDQMSEISNETISLSYQGDEISMQSDSNFSSASQIDIEVTSADRSDEVNRVFTRQDNWSPSTKVPNKVTSTLEQKIQSYRLSEDGPLTEFMKVNPEQPSPVSVLDASTYRDDFSSPDVKTKNPGDYTGEEQNAIDLDHLYEGRKKLENVEHLVQKLRRLNSDHDESTTDYIASLCDNDNPEHRYISEILLASGLLLGDLGSGFTSLQPHLPGHPINPDLFYVLEQTKNSNILPGNNISDSDQEKVHRKLIFDSVNEILEHKLDIMSPLSNPCLRSNKLIGRSQNAQQLLRDLCSEIENLQLRKNSYCNFEGDNNLKNILFKDVTSLSHNWTVSNGEVSGVVLDVERMIFKDLIGEIVNGELIIPANAKQSRRRRQLFAM